MEYLIKWLLIWVVFCAALWLFIVTIGLIVVKIIERLTGKDLW